MSETTTQLTVKESAFSLESFEHAQRVAVMMAKSTLVPEQYRGKVENVMIAMEMSYRMEISPLMVMQNLHIVKGNPGWSGSFVIAMINGSKRFDDDLEFEFSGKDDDYGCMAVAIKKGKRIEGTKVTWKMVKGENWLNKDGSKWKTMPDQMFRYRSAAFFGRVHTPDLLMGMQTAEEIQDVIYTDFKPAEEVRKGKEGERVAMMIKEAKTLEDLEKIAPHVQEEQLDLFTVKKDELTAKK